jgi:membrane protein required for colicin V production
MQDFTTFDIVVLALTLFLGLKGLFKGFIKEAFGFIGIIGGIFVASRMSDTIGTLVAPILGLENEATISLLGFIAGLIGFWLIVYFLGIILSKITAMSGLGAIDRLLGFIFGGAKIFFIFAIIAYAVSQVDTFKKTLDEQFGTSIMFPLLVKSGSFIIKLDTSKFTKTIDEGVDAVVPKENATPATQELKEKIQEGTKEISKAIEENSAQIISDKVKKEVEEKTQAIKDAVNNTSTKE